MTYDNYAWIINKDYTTDLADHEPRFNARTQRYEHSIPKRFDAADVSGPRNAHPDAIEALKAGKGEAFQLWDDDGILYYSGRWFEDCAASGFGEGGGIEGDPLNDYGTPNAGCASMTVGNRRPYIG